MGEGVGVDVGVDVGVCVCVWVVRISSWLPIESGPHCLHAAELAIVHGTAATSPQSRYMHITRTRDGNEITLARSNKEN